MDFGDYIFWQVFDNQPKHTLYAMILRSGLSKKVGYFNFVWLHYSNRSLFSSIVNVGYILLHFSSTKTNGLHQLFVLVIIVSNASKNNPLIILHNANIFFSNAPFLLYLYTN